MYCNSCGNELRDNVKFCTNCGCKVKSETEKNIKVEDESFYCRNCGEKVPISSLVCLKCGYRLKDGSNNSGNDDDFIINLLVYIVSFLFPIFGIIFWAVTKEENHIRAKKALILSLINVGIIILTMLCVFLFVAIFIFSNFGGM